MKTSFSSLLVALPIVVATVLTGCAADGNGDQTDQSAGAATATTSAPITIANYMTHPKIKAIRDQVNAIEHLALTKATNPGCDGSNDKYTDAQGRIRKLVTEGGEGDTSGSTTVYYNERNQPIFEFSKNVDYNGDQAATVTEMRIYFDVTTTHTLFQAVRQNQTTAAAVADPAIFADILVNIPDRLPKGDEVVASSAVFGSPEEFFASTGCAQPEKQ